MWSTIHGLSRPRCAGMLHMARNGTQCVVLRAVSTQNTLFGEKKDKYKFNTEKSTMITRQHAKDLIYRLHKEERKILLDELSKYNTADTQPPATETKPTAAQLRAIAIHNALPFVGFGFLDNFIMICAGDYIDLTLGMTFGISTMAAAGLGNTISDVAGIGSAWYVERLAFRVGVEVPNLTPAQLDMTSTRVTSNLGRALGVLIGCLIGMCPLLFIDTSKDDKEEKEDSKAKES